MPFTSFQDMESLNSSQSSLNDPVNHPEHYTQANVECIDAIKSALTEDEFRGFIKGQILKYTWRERFKNGVEDLKKCQWYLEYYINNFEEF